MNIEKCQGTGCANDTEIEEFVVNHQLTTLLNQGSYSSEDYSQDYIRRFSSVKAIPLTIERPSPCSTMMIVQNRVESADSYFTSLVSEDQSFFTVEDYKALPINLDTEDGEAFNHVYRQLRF